jgi:hypothetical protein
VSASIKITSVGNYQLIVDQPGEHPLFVGPGQEITIEQGSPVDMTINITEEDLDAKAAEEQAQKAADEALKNVPAKDGGSGSDPGAMSGPAQNL